MFTEVILGCIWLLLVVWFTVLHRTVVKILWNLEEAKQRAEQEDREWQEKMKS